MASKATIGERIKLLRGELTQREFGEFLGFSHGFIGDIERGRSYPSIGFLLALAVNCRSNLNWILTGEGPLRRPFAGQTRRGGPTSDGGPLDKDEPGAFTAALVDLLDMFTRADQDTRTWMKVQLARAFPEVRPFDPPYIPMAVAREGVQKPGAFEGTTQRRSPISTRS